MIELRIILANLGDPFPAKIKVFVADKIQSQATADLVASLRPESQAGTRNPPSGYIMCAALPRLRDRALQDDFGNDLLYPCCGVSCCCGDGLVRHVSVPGTCQISQAGREARCVAV